LKINREILSMKKKLVLVFLAVFIFVLTFNCTKKEQPKEEVKKAMKGTLRELVEFIKNKTEVVILGDEKSKMLVITPERGAKIVGMSFNGIDGENLLWVPEAILTDTFWIKPRWNLGGARSWISPEDQFYLDEKNVWFVPDQMDPGKYIKETSSNENIKCSNTFEIKNKEGKNYKVKLTRNIDILKDIPDNLKEGGSQFKYVGFKFTHELENLSDKIIGKDIPYMGLWSLIQLKANGTMIIPINNKKDTRGESFRNYFNVFTPDRISTADDHITVKLDGKFRGKIGIAPWAAKENLACLYNGSDGNGLLFLKEFSVNEKGRYLDKPWGKPSEYGDAVQMYNDDGKMGGFCEMECHAPAVEIAKGEKISHTVKFSIFEGKVQELKKFMEGLLKIDPTRIKYYE
jgi:hypothetical protein